jgi:hypothetical protein
MVACDNLIRRKEAGQTRYYDTTPGSKLMLLKRELRSRKAGKM